ncbi:MAG: peptide chain release factor N(5)-glutamine methyltransferase [Lachnospiraceae bacterium]|nr:peptide chain release factor N(5)-glutamine methyltransferase [Lachnospiraceae bacterium]MDY4118349.1 peptide chain release factor N(5)-glutamine methyltransferase [Lachnospiraceae bacterium]
MQYRELYRMGKDRLMEAKIPEAELDARLLLEEVCGTDRNDLLVHGDREIAPEQSERYLDFIHRRQKHEPLQQITGYQEFMGLRFKVTPDVLIPRQDTEILVEEVMRYLHDGMHILDMCTGSGCILLSLLKYSNDCEGTGCDISEPALKVAEENAKELSLNASFVQSNLFENISGKYEFIVSNPPYIPTGVIPTLMEEVRDHEPVSALDGREDGLYFYREIVEKAGEYLYPGGMLFFEIGYDQAEKVSSLMQEAGYQEVTVCKDLAGLDRVVYGTLL